MVGTVYPKETRKNSEKGLVHILVNFAQIRTGTPGKCRTGTRDRQENGDGFWHKALEKEIRNVFPAFEFLDDDNDTKKSHLDMLL
jgi:hypothetical protein